MLATDADAVLVPSTIYLSASIVVVQLDVSAVADDKRYKLTRLIPRGGVRLSLGSWVLAACMAIGLIMAGVTVFLSAANAISVQQAIAMALVSAVTVIAGLARTIAPDVYKAWRRGFRLGCQTTLRARGDGPRPNGDTEADRDQRER